MRYGSLPDVNGRVSRLVMGSMIFSNDNLERTFQLLDRFVEAGGTAIDTARVYAKGTSEQAFGEWLKTSGRRDQMIVIGKGARVQCLGRYVGTAQLSEPLPERLPPRPWERHPARLRIRSGTRAAVEFAHPWKSGIRH